MSLELTHLLVFRCQPFERVVAIHPGGVGTGRPPISGRATVTDSFTDFGPVSVRASGSIVDSVVDGPVVGVCRLPSGFLCAFAFLVLLRHPGIPFGVDLSRALLQRFLHLEVIRRRKRIEPACRRWLGWVPWQLRRIKPGALQRSLPWDLTAERNCALST
ncbi:hypothetical protein [Brevibacterium casei]|uniref:hypothetical protein n=1 Tax=Brevibacterium casei TaxID=33889 RepID=UPI00223C3B34|nr:hypothetical protein [Brevibacterium casei]MCT1448146.1 hypothetical protein [Brevibacterium casei]